MNEKTKILIVDDDKETREMYAEIFKNSDFKVIEAKDGVEGLDKATTEAPNVIFTGIIMPRMDGFSLMESLKKNLTTSEIPVVVSSHMGREEDRQKANVLGARYFIVRGFTTPNELVKKVKSLFIGGKEYHLEINNFSMDAQKLAQDLGLNNNFECLECDDKLIMKVIASDKNGGGLEAHLVCPSCGWQAK
ncbi:MAG: response regulator [bacterium]|nr:response regulator [bacterium]